MTIQPLENIEQLEASLWSAADNLRANSKLTRSEYCMPVVPLQHSIRRKLPPWIMSWVRWSVRWVICSLATRPVGKV